MTTLYAYIEGIDSLRNKITNAKSVGITQNIIDELYTNVKLIFLKPAKTTGMTKIVKHTKFSRRSRRHAKHKWFTKECEILRKDYMFKKNGLLKHIRKLFQKLRNCTLKSFMMTSDA